ncbi:MAG TPA: glycosyltransferase family 39 protein [Blastocatellia bacterium]|nr:glycosyltransferase family 39 protein [Blastocatellia bacterium]
MNFANETSREGRRPGWVVPLVVGLLQLLVLIFIARQHPIGAFATETDFYHLYAPDAERLADGRFPENPFQGPGYPALLAAIVKLTGLDLFTAGKWLSVLCAIGCGLLIFVLFQRLFGYWVGVGAQAIMIVSGEFPQFSINATTDLFFLLLCLGTLIVLTGEWPALRWRIGLAGALGGITYLTRYNGLFLLVVTGLAIVLLNLFEQGWRERLVLAAILIAAFLTAASPWLYANYRHRGSPFYNTNYLNLATEFYPELVAGKTNQDGTRLLEQKFHSFGEVLAYDPGRIIKHYPLNLYENLRNSIRDGLVNQWVGWVALVGIALALIRRRTKSLWLLLMAGAAYLMLMSLNHWEVRYYFFVMALYAGFAVYAVSQAVRERWIPAKSPAAVWISVGLFAAIWGLSFAESRRDVKKFLGGQPLEVIAARDYLSQAHPAGSRLRIVARKPHLPYLSGSEWIFFPQVKSIDDFRVWVAENRIDYIAIGRRELRERKELAPLGDPTKAPDWIKAVWMNSDPLLILYKPN